MHLKNAMSSSADIVVIFHRPEYISTMNRLQAYKFEITPNGEQIRMMRKYAGNARKVWNLALDRQEKNHEAGEKFTGAKGMNYWIPEWKKEFPFLRESPAQTLQQVMENLAKAYEKFFKKTADHPVFKKKGKSADSFRFPDPKQFTVDQENSRIKLPKLGWIRYRNSRSILGVPKNITVSAKAGKWFFSVQTGREVDQLYHPATSMVGIDVGIKRFATLSDATYVEPLSAFRKHEVNLAKYQRRMSHIKRHSNKQFSNNWKRAKARVQKTHSHIANARNDFLHKATTTISKNHAIVCIENLQVGNMSRSAAGTSKAPGRSVKAKSGLNKSILDQGWGEFRRQLEYKQVWLRGEVLAVPPHNTSRTCPACGHVSADNRKTQAKFECIECGYSNNADVVGAINILNRGIKMLEGQDTVDASTGCASIAQIACEVNGAVMPSATGTRRSDSGEAQCHA
jgi:putative transposase